MKEALKLALDVLESDYVFEWPAMQRPERVKKKRFEAITAIKEALAQPEQEPVGRISADCEGILRQEVMLYTDKPLKIGTAVYTAPPKRPWVGMTDEQIKQIRFNTITELVTMEESELRFARAIEAKLKEKNT